MPWITSARIAGRASYARAHAPVDVQHVTAHEARCVAREKHDGTCKLIHLTPRPCRCAVFQPRVELRVLYDSTLGSRIPSDGRARQLALHRPDADDLAAATGDHSTRNGLADDEKRP